MTIQNYALIDNLPPPVTSGTTIQSFTDVMTGEVWVAKNGVQSGNWRKARDVLHSLCYRSTSVAMPTASAILQFDSARNDTWGLYVGSTNFGFAVPLSGWYRAYAALEVTVAVAGTYIQGNIMQNNVTNWSSDNWFSTRASGGLCWKSQALMFLSAGDIVNVHGYQTNGYSYFVTGTWSPCHFEISYLGTG